MLEAGVPVEKILNAFLVPLTKQHIKAALQYAGSLTKGGDNVVVSIKKQETKISA